MSNASFIMVLQALFKYSRVLRHPEIKRSTSLLKLPGRVNIHSQATIVPAKELKKN